MVGISNNLPLFFPIRTPLDEQLIKSNLLAQVKIEILTKQNISKTV